MKNIFLYLKQGGNFTFEEAEFNEIDNLVFCALSYICFDSIIKKEDIISLKDLYIKYQSILDKKNLFKINQNYLFELVSHSRRFKDILLSYYVNEIDIEEEKQFCAMTFILPLEKLFVAFKGTDETVIGWKEDFDMSYQVVPAQKRARSYLDEILKNTKKEVFVGGHSKGGNLAMYASIFCSDELKSKLIKVYNNDGPGLNKNVLNQENLKKLENKIITFIPESSIIGNLFENFSKTVIIESNSLGILQHDLYTWLVFNNHFVYSKKMDKKTQELCVFLNQQLDKLSPSKKRDIINFIYDIFISYGITNIEDKIHDVIQNNQLLKKYHFHLEDIEILRTIIPLVIRIMKSL